MQAHAGQASQCRDFRSTNGVFGVTINNAFGLQGLNQNDDHTVGVQVVGLKNHMESIVSQKGEDEGVMTPQLFPLTRGTWQSNDKKFIRVDNILNSWIIVHIYRGKLSSVKGNKPICSYVAKMDDSHNLIDGQQLTFLFAPTAKRDMDWDFYYSDTQKLDYLLKQQE